jgi:hypothetical protein
MIELEGDQDENELLDWDTRDHFVRLKRRILIRLQKRMIDAETKGDQEEKASQNQKEIQGEEKRQQESLSLILFFLMV